MHNPPVSDSKHATAHVQESPPTDSPSSSCTTTHPSSSSLNPNPNPQANLTNLAFDALSPRKLSTLHAAHAAASPDKRTRLQIELQAALKRRRDRVRARHHTSSWMKCGLSGSGGWGDLSLDHDGGDGVGCVQELRECDAGKDEGEDEGVVGGDAVSDKSQELGYTTDDFTLFLDNDRVPRAERGDDTDLSTFFPSRDTATDSGVALDTLSLNGTTDTDSVVTPFGTPLAKDGRELEAVEFADMDSDGFLATATPFSTPTPKAPIKSSVAVDLSGQPLVYDSTPASKSELEHHSIPAIRLFRGHTRSATVSTEYESDAITEATDTASVDSAGLQNMYASQYELNRRVVSNLSTTPLSTEPEPPHTPIAAFSAAVAELSPQPEPEPPCELLASIHARLLRGCVTVLTSNQATVLRIEQLLRGADVLFDAEVEELLRAWDIGAGLCW